MNTIAIKTTNLRKTYTTGSIDTEVIKGIDLDIHKGDFVSIMGPSGSGKSTLLYLIGGLESPSDGHIHISGNIINDMSDKQISYIRSKKIGFVFQFYNLVPHLNVVDNILLPALLSGAKKNVLMKRLKPLLKTVSLSDKMKSYPSELSGGQQQRVAIARALIQEPEILLADEPIGNLDTKTGGDIMDLFLKINKELGTTILQVTHSESSAEYGNKLINLKDGVIVSTSTQEKRYA